MSEKVFVDFRNIELNTELLKTPYRVQTNWHVLAGAPSSGKSTLLNQLAEQGFATLPEGARDYINTELGKGRTIEDIRSDQVGLNQYLIYLQVEAERKIAPKDFIFLDRGIPDHFAYCRIAGQNPNDFLLECFHHRYASVFVLAPLPYDHDGARDRDAAFVDEMDRWTMRDYHDLGYDVVRVPVLPRDARLAFVLENLSAKGYF